MVYYNIDVTLPGGAISSATCANEFFGIIPQYLFPFDIDIDGYAIIPNVPDLIFNGEEIYYDTVYRLEFYYDIPNFVDPTKRGLEGSNFGLYLFNPAGFYISGQDDPVYDSPDFFQFNDLCMNAPTGSGSDCSNCCYSSVDFCLPSDPSNSVTFQQGSQYKLVLATPKNLINPIPEEQNGIYLDYVIIEKSFHHFDG